MNRLILLAFCLFTLLNIYKIALLIFQIALLDIMSVLTLNVHVIPKNNFLNKFIPIHKLLKHLFKHN